MGISSLSTSFLVRIIENRPAYYGQRYDLELFGFGCATSAEAKLEAERHLARLRAEPRLHWCSKTVSETEVPSTYHAVLYRGCDHCHVSGIEPNYKRKKCSVCGGLGTLPGHGGE